MADRTCTTPDCGAPHYSKGMCKPCYRRDYYRRNRARELAQNAAWVAERPHYRRDQSRRLNADEIAARTAALAARLNDSHKTCTRCGRYLPKSEYYNDRRRRDGLFSACRRCFNGYEVERRRSEEPWTRERRRERDRERWLSDPEWAESRREAHRRWVAANPEKNREYATRRRALTPDPVDYGAVLAEHGMTCHLCLEDIPTMDVLHFDHVVPLSRGGEHAESNIRPAHAVCNLRKGAKLMSELDWIPA